MGKRSLCLTQAFDPAAKDSAKSIAGSLFHVSGIPTQYVIGKDGKVAAALVGFEGEKDHRLEAELAKLGITDLTAKL